jgi:hypothetical protein
VVLHFVGFGMSAPQRSCSKPEQVPSWSCRRIQRHHRPYSPSRYVHRPLVVTSSTVCLTSGDVDSFLEAEVMVTCGGVSLDLDTAAVVDKRALCRGANSSRNGSATTQTFLSVTGMIAAPTRTACPPAVPRPSALSARKYWVLARGSSRRGPFSPVKNLASGHAR